MRKFIFIPFLCSALSMMGAANTEVHFHNETADTTRINELLIDVLSQDFKNPEARTGYIARKFIGTPYVAHTLEGSPETLTVNLDELDCTTFVETALALSYTAGEQRSSWRDYVYNLERIRYRNGEVNGYASRLHYISDWVVDNVHRGNFEEVTKNFPRISYIVRTIDYMSSNRDKYPALADSMEYERIRSAEDGYRNHRFPYVKSIDIADKATRAAFRDGDVVALVTTMKNLDVTHMGVIVMQNDVPYLLHASSTDGKVEISTLPLYEYLKKQRSICGLRIFRLKE
jgi:hypothetical protein